MSHSLRVGRHESLVSPDSGVVVDVSGLGQANNRVDEDIGPPLSCGSDSEFSVGSVHGVSSLESDNGPPRELVKVCSKLGGSVYQSAMSLRGERDKLTSEGNVIKVIGSLDGLDFTTNIELLGLVV